MGAVLGSPLSWDGGGVGAGNCLHKSTENPFTRILGVPSLILSFVSDVYMTKTNGFKVRLCVEVMREKRPQREKRIPLEDTSLILLK